jgi:leucyl/phenylalanyl-tRNA---protein transferase
VEPPQTAWSFPPAWAADPEGRVAMGADTEPGTILAAYRQGIFPMPVGARRPLLWWSPALRGVLPLSRLRVTRSMRQSSRRYEIRVDTAFDEVIAGCADRRRPGGWIDARMLTAYRRLHRMGWAHSVEAWHDGELAGGLYGVGIGGLFAGESMFHRQRDASKVALMSLVGLLARDGVDRLLDVQWCTPHLASMGAVEIPRDDYLARLETALELPAPEFLRR